MVQFKKESIVITIETVESPFVYWAKLNKCFVDVCWILLSNEMHPPSEYDLGAFNDLHDAVSKLDISYEQKGLISTILTKQDNA